MFEGFTRTDIDTGEARIHLRHGGSGPPLLLLHGNPMTHVSWHKMASELARDYHVPLHERLLYRWYWGPRLVPAQLEHALYTILWRARRPGRRR